MKLRNFVLPALLVPTLLLLGACETASKKRTVVATPPATLPPPIVETPVPIPVVQKPVELPFAPEPDPVVKLIADSEAAYQEGVQAYRSGHLERAKREFDRAVEMLLGISAELRSDPRVEKQFDRLVEEIHRYEVVALKEGDGFTERAPVPAPVDEIAELTFPSDPRLKEKVEREVKDTASDLPLVINDYVLGYINYFATRGRASIENALRRAGRYRDMISRIFKEEGVPQDLIYLAQAESAFQPWALSRAGARGIWQFMASRGREYELDVNWWVDERQDPEKSTRAAARHLKDLHNLFGDWYLAMAAYNSGPGGVQRAVERTGYADFWELYQRNALPRETRNYVPIILATTIVAKNPEKYGLDNILPDSSVQTETVTITTPTDLRLISETIDCSVGLLQTLNPSLLRIVTPKGDFQLNLPAGTKERFLQQIALIPEDKRVFWRWHKVNLGESLGEIAHKYKTTPDAIARVNSLEGEELQVGAKLVIPVTTARDGGDGSTRTVRLRYRVRRGDTVARVADRFGVSPSELRAWNRLRGNGLAPGRVLVVRAAASAPPGSVSDGVSRPHKRGAAVAKSRKSKKLASKAGSPELAKTAPPPAVSP